MTAIAPNSTIRLFSGVPLDNTYTDTLFFDSLGAQRSYFGGLNATKTFTNNYYQRVNSNTFQADCVADDIYNCNYMSFQNTSFGDKWFYAFITSIEYINNHNSLVTYELDVMQTYLFDAELEHCFVEREHSETDIAGENIMPEPVALAEYVYDNKRVIGGEFPYRKDTCVMYVDVNGSAVQGASINGIYSGSTLVAFDDSASAYQAIDQLLEDYIQKPEAICNIYCTPHFCSQGTPSGVTYGFNTENVPLSTGLLAVGGAFQPERKTIEGYKIKNQKLLTYPYSYLFVDNGCGQSRVYRYEFFKSKIIYFEIHGTIIPPVQLTLVPSDYKIDNQEVFNEQISISSYPTCSWNYDTYKAWASQNTVPMIIDGLGAVASAATGTVGGGLNALGTVGGMIKQWYSASIAADTIKGQLYAGNAMFASNSAKFYAMDARQPIEVIKTIDDFFNMYGYTTHRVKIPNRKVRPHWTYTKTNGCKVIGECPNNALSKICEIYDKGITFWVKADEVGNYSLDNSPS